MAASTTVRGVSATLQPGGINRFGPNAQAGNIFGTLTLIDSLVTTMQGIGSGDNSANVVTLAAYITTLEAALASNVTVLADAAALTKTQVRRGAEHAITALIAGSNFSNT